MLFSVTTKNLNWEILTKNLVTFKRWDGVKDAKFAGSLRIQFIGGEGAWIVCRFNRGLGKKKYCERHFNESS